MPCSLLQVGDLFHLRNRQKPCREGRGGSDVAAKENTDEVHAEIDRVTLDDQDRTLWDRALIAEGSHLIEAAFASGPPGAYQLQAAIAAVHDAAPSTEATDWAEIAGLYGVLLQLADNPMVKLNRAIAIAMLDGPARGLELIDELERDERIAGHYRLDAVRAHLHERAGNRDAAVHHYKAAAARTTSIPERDYLIARAARVLG